MAKTCDGCNNTELVEHFSNKTFTPVTMSEAQFELMEERHERRERRFMWLVALLIVLLVLTNLGWIYYESQFETIDDSMIIDQDADGGNNNYIGNSGDIYNGTPNNN